MLAQVFHTGGSHGFDESVTHDAILVMGAAQYDGRPSPQLDKAMNFLLEMLKDGKPVRQKELEEQAHQAGHAWRTVQRAKDRLGVESRKRTKEEDPETPWEWWLTVKASI